MSFCIKCSWITLPLALLANKQRTYCGLVSTSWKGENSGALWLKWCILDVQPHFWLQWWSKIFLYAISNDAGRFGKREMLFKVQKVPLEPLNCFTFIGFPIPWNGGKPGLPFLLLYPTVVRLQRPKAFCAPFMILWSEILGNLSLLVEWHYKSRNGPSVGSY